MFSRVAVGEGQRIGLGLLDDEIAADTPFVVYVSAPAARASVKVERGMPVARIQAVQERRKSFRTKTLRLHPRENLVFEQACEALNGMDARNSCGKP
jgi:hypothetical protein